MIQKTQAEREAVKKAKREFKRRQTAAPLNVLDVEKHTHFNSTGILKDERILPDDYPVYFDYYYVVDDETGHVIKSSVQGNIKTLKNDLRKSGYKAENIYNCHIIQRMTKNNNTR